MILVPNGLSYPTLEGVTFLIRIISVKINHKGSSRLLTVDNRPLRVKCFSAIGTKNRNISSFRFKHNLRLLWIVSSLSISFRFSPNSQGSKAIMTAVLFEVVLCSRSWPSAFKMDWVRFIRMASDSLGKDMIPSSTQKLRLTRSFTSKSANSTVFSKSKGRNGWRRTMSNHSSDSVFYKFITKIVVSVPQESHTRKHLRDVCSQCYFILPEKL